MEKLRLDNLNAITTWEKLQMLRAQLKAYFKQREHLVDGLILALLARAHILILGPPGTAKSDLAHTLCMRFEGAEYFFYWLNKFTTWKDIACGPVIVKENSDQAGKSIHFLNTEGRLLKAILIFLDEIDKVSIATANACLPLLNERKYSINPGEVRESPVVSIVAACNKLPSTGELLPLLDRFLLRYEVGYISVSHEGDSDFIDMLEESAPLPDTQLTLEELLWLQSEVSRIKIDRKLLCLISSIRSTLKLEHRIEPSDRRFVKSKSLIKATAFMNGHARAEIEDLSILENVLWTGSEPREREMVRRVVHEVTRDPSFLRVAELVSEAHQVFSEAADLLKQGLSQIPLNDAHKRTRSKLLADAGQREKRLEGIHSEAAKLVEDTAPEKQTPLQTMTNEINAFRKRLVALRRIEDPFLGVEGWNTGS